jgi:hypothetical protein
MSASFIRTVVQRVCLGFGIVLLGAATIDYWVVTVRVNAAADERLVQSARLINQLANLSPDRQALQVPPDVSPTTSDIRKLQNHSADSQTGFEIWSNANVLIAGSEVIGGTALDAAPPGFADVSIRDHRWRIFTFLGDEGRWVRVGESYKNRHAIHDYLLFSGLSSLLMVPLLAFLMREGIRTSIMPLRSLGNPLGMARSN